jgi:1-acyl-sn-glycerol-3-phosphate acyltransferase
MEVMGSAHIPAEGPCLVVCNHYSPLWFPSWWLVLSISAAVVAQRTPEAEREIHWVMAGAWTYPDSPWRRQVLTPATWWAFRRVARVYGFVTMPPMPPDPSEVEARAVAVRQTVRLARRLAPAGGMVGLSPEGQAVREAHVEEPPAGVGEFIALLVRAGLPVLPVGVKEVEGRLRLSFGPAFVPEIPAGRGERDRVVARQVMEAIGRQLT